MCICYEHKPMRASGFFTLVARMLTTCFMHRLKDNFAVQNPTAFYSRLYPGLRQGDEGDEIQAGCGRLVCASTRWDSDSDVTICHALWEDAACLRDRAWGFN